MFQSWISFNPLYLCFYKSENFTFHPLIVGFDNLKETIEANYRKVKEEILSLVDSEIMRIKNDPKLAHLIKM